MAVRLRFGIAIALVTAALGFLWHFCIPPEHWLREVRDFASVNVDDRPVRADVYIGHPTEREAEAFLMVNVAGIGNYLFNFEEESFREVSSSEFIWLHGRVFVFKPVSQGRWVAPLPPGNVNEFRVASNRHIVTVRF